MTIEATITVTHKIQNVNFGDTIGNCGGTVVDKKEVMGTVTAIVNPSHDKCPGCFYRELCSASISKEINQ